MEYKYLKIGAILLFAVLLFGCTSTPDDGATPSNGDQVDDEGTGNGGAENGANGGTGDTGNADLVEWCQAGATWNWAGEEGSAEMVVTGMVEYKGDSYCHVEVVTESTGQGTVTIEYYFKESEGETVDMWMVMYDDQGNLMSEQHVVSQG